MKAAVVFRFALLLCSSLLFTNILSAQCPVLINPVGGQCPDSDQIVRFAFENPDTIKAVVSVQLSVWGPHFNKSFSVTDTLERGNNWDTLTIGTINTTGGGTFKFNYSSILKSASSTAACQDSLFILFSKTIPNEIHARDSVMCDIGKAGIFIPGQRNSITGWFEDSSSTHLSDTGSSNTKVLTQSKTFYVQNFSTLNDSLRLIGNHTAMLLPDTVVHGYFFDLNTSSAVILDSIGVKFSASDSLEVYFKEGSALGYEKVPSAWARITKTYVHYTNNNSFIYIHIVPKLLQAKETYSIYIWTKKGSIPHWGAIYGPLVNSTSQFFGSVQIWGVSKSYSSSGKFENFLKTPATSPEGYLFYRSLSSYCHSSRKAIYRRVKPSAIGYDFKQGTPYKGLFYGGNITNPDQMCPEDTLTYEFLPPTVYTNADYNKRWKIISKKFYTQSGQAIPDTLTKAPNGSHGFLFQVFPSAKYKDSLLSMQIVFAADDTCVHTLTRSIQVSGLPSAAFTFDTACFGTAFQFSNQAVIDKPTTGDFILSRHWDFGDGSMDSSGYPAHSYAQPGKYKVSLNIVTHTGCTDIKTATVTVLHHPKVDFTTTPLCAGIPVTFSDSSLADDSIAAQYWKFPDGSVQYSAHPALRKFSLPGKYKVVHAIATLHGCTDTISKILTVLSPPSPKALYSAACVDEAGLFRDTSRADKGLSYFWDFGDSATSSDPAPSHIYKKAGGYLVTLTVNNSTGCSTEKKFYAVPFDPPAAKFYHTEACTGMPMKFIDSTVYNAPPSLVDWDFGDGTTVSGRSTLNHTYVKAGSYNVKLNVQNANGCKDSIEKTITIHEVPVADFNVPDTNCSNSSVQFKNTSSDSGNVAYEWNFGDSTAISTLGNPVHIYNNPGNYTVTLKCLSVACSDQKSEILNIAAKPLEPVWYYQTLGDTAFLFADSQTSVNKYQWSFGDKDTLYGRKVKKYFADFSTPQDICLTVFNSVGCSGSLCRTVDLKTAIQGQASALNLKLYPNPSGGEATLDYDVEYKTLTRISLLDMSSREISILKQPSAESAGHHQLIIPANALRPGVYFIRIISAGECIMLKFVRT
jgi:PKD repeat protein